MIKLWRKLKPGQLVQLIQYQQENHGYGKALLESLQAQKDDVIKVTGEVEDREELERLMKIRPGGKGLD